MQLRQAILIIAQSINQLTQFVKDIPNIADQFDAETLNVGGKRIDQLFRERVDSSGFVESIDEQSVIDAFSKEVWDTGSTKEYVTVVGGTQREVKENLYNPTAAREKFESLFSGTDELAKLRRTLLIQHESIEDEALREDFEDNYMAIGEDDEAYVTDDGVFNYIMDTEIEPNRYEISTKPYEGDRLTAKQRQDRRDEMLDDRNILRNLNEARTLEMTGLKGHDINVDGLQGNIIDGKISYNPFTGQRATVVNFSVEEDGSVYYFNRFYEDGIEGLQELGHHVYGDKVDYRSLRERLEGQTGESFAPPIAPITFDDRQDGIDRAIDNYRYSFEQVLNARNTEEDMRVAAERAWSIATETHPEIGTTNKPLAHFMADYLGANKARGMFGIDGLGVGDAAAKGYGLNNAYGISFDQELDLENGDMNKQAVAEKLGKITAMARALKADGVADEEIAKRLVQAAKEYDKQGDISFEYDRVKRNIGGDVQKMNTAQELLKAGFNDNEILGAIEGKTYGIEWRKKVKWAEQKGEFSEQAWEDMAKANGVTVEQAKVKYFNKQFKKK